MLGASLNLTCVAVGAPMPFVKWKKDPATDLTPDDNLPVGKNVLVLTDIQESANYTCTAASDLGVIETTTMVKVQCWYPVCIPVSSFRLVDDRIFFRRLSLFIAVTSVAARIA